MQSLHPYSPYPRSYNLDSRPDRTLQNTVIAVSKVALSILATLSAYLYLPTPLFLLTAVTCIIINIPAAQDQVARFIHYPPPTAEALSPRHLFRSPPTARRGESDTRASHTQVGSRGFDPAWDDFNHGEESKTAGALSPRLSFTSPPTARRGESGTRASHAQVGSKGFDPAWGDFNHGEESKTDQQLTSRWGMTDTPMSDQSASVCPPPQYRQRSAGESVEHFTSAEPYSVGRPLTSIAEQPVGRPLYAPVGIRASAKARHDPNGWGASYTDGSVTSGWAMTDTPERDPSPRVYHPAGHPQDAAQNTLGRPLHAQAGRRVSDDQRATSQEEKGAEELAPFIQRQHSQVGFRK